MSSFRFLSFQNLTLGDAEVQSYHVTCSTSVARACRETQAGMSPILVHSPRLLSPAIWDHSTMSAKKERKVMNENGWADVTSVPTGSSNRLPTTSIEQTADYSSEKLECCKYYCQNIPLCHDCWNFLKTVTNWCTSEITWNPVHTSRWSTLAVTYNLDISVKLVKLHRNVRLSN